MASCCHTCNHREHAVHATPSSPTLLDVCIITLTFATRPFSAAGSPLHPSLSTLLKNINDAVESASRPWRFTSWSHRLSDPKTVVILTTASDTCARGDSLIFEPILKELACPPTVRHVWLDYAAVSLGACSKEQTIPCDLVVVRALSPEVAGAVGRRFGWDPKRSSLSAQLEVNAPVGFSRPGDLVRDFWAWAEMHFREPMSPSNNSSTSLGSEYEGVLKNTNSDQKSASPCLIEDDMKKDTEEETLVMLFLWSSRVDADRFKHPLQKSYGLNGQEIAMDTWDRQVAHPLRQLQSIGAKVDLYRLELRGVEQQPGAARRESRQKSGGRRLSDLATGLSERVSGFWK